MLYWRRYKGHATQLIGNKKKYDPTIYTFDIETSSYIKIGDKIIAGCKYLELSEDEKKVAEYHASMYIWMLGINDTVYYGRTWDELKSFLHVIDTYIPEEKYFFIHNLAFEFQFMKGVFHFKDVMARKSRKVMTARLRDYNIILKCSYIMSNCNLAVLPKVFKLPVEKKVGDLDYDLIRNSKTELTDKEMGYCEYDCLVVYYYILEEIKTYGDVKHIPTTSTGHVRRELYNLVLKDFKYRRIVTKAINTNPHVYNLLQDAFMGGYTHANWIYTDEVIENVDSYDETSAYPYCLVSYKYPSSEFRECKIKYVSEMSRKFCYLLVVRFKNIKSKYYNSFISSSKCRNIKGAKYDNGRIIEAEEFETTITDIDFYLYLDTYECEYEIIESYYANKAYLPKKFIEFVLEKYVKKTQYKNVPDMELEYTKEKNKFNALYGMSVTNTIRDNVDYLDDLGIWEEKPLTNDEIEEKLNKEKKKGFLSFAYGIFVTAYARDNLIRRMMELDEYVVYGDTDSIKLRSGYNKEVFTKYNNKVKRRIENVSKLLKIGVENYAPYDIYGVPHMLGLFESETKDGREFTYDKFITQGAKKYAYEIDGKIHITVAGVPKSGSKVLKDLKDFKDDLVFDHDITKKNMLMYNDNQSEVILTDYQGNVEKVTEKSGCCILPTTYVLGKSYDYMNLLTDNSSNRARYKE